MKKFFALLCVVLALTIACSSALAAGVHVGTVANKNTVLCSKDFSKMVQKLSRGQRVLYWDTGVENVVKVVTQSGTVGYCYDGYIRSVAEVDKSVVVKTRNSYTDVYYLKNGVLDMAMTVSGTIPLILLDTDGTWCKVKNLRGKIGYIRKADLKKVW